MEELGIALIIIGSLIVIFTILLWWAAQGLDLSGQEIDDP